MIRHRSTPDPAARAPPGRHAVTDRVPTQHPTNDHCDEREIAMLSLQFHLSQAATEMASVPTAMAAGEVRTAFAGVLLLSALATFAAIVSAAGRLLKQAVELLEQLIRMVLLATLAGVVVAAVVILAFADLLAR
jgi:hypothetical protein